MSGHDEAANYSGYGPFPRFLWDALSASNWPPTHFRIVMTILRLTIGYFDHESAEISYATIAERTGISERNVRRAWRELHEAGVIAVVGDRNAIEPLIIGQEDPGADHDGN